MWVSAIKISAASCSVCSFDCHLLLNFFLCCGLKGSLREKKEKQCCCDAEIQHVKSHSVSSALGNLADLLRLFLSTFWKTETDRCGSNDTNLERRSYQRWRRNVLQHVLLLLGCVLFVFFITPEYFFGVYKMEFSHHFCSISYVCSMMPPLHSCCVPGCLTFCLAVFA